MTIFTVANTEKPKEAQVLINPETTVKVEFKQAQRDAVVKQQQRKVHAAINELIQRRRRRYVVMNVVVALTSLLVVVAGIFGGMYIYKWITYSRIAMQGSCTVSYHEEARIESYAQSQMQQRRGGQRYDETGRQQVFPAGVMRSRGITNRQQQYGTSGRFVEKYNVLNQDQEMLQVPQPGLGAFDVVPINIIHDFSAKLTAIVDAWNSRCFVKPLDPSVVPPRDFIDLLRRIEDGSYVPNVCLIRKHYRAQQPPLDAMELAELRSEIVVRNCDQYATYQLVRIDAVVTSTLPPATTPQTLLDGDDDVDYEQGFDDSDDEDNDEDEAAYVSAGDMDASADVRARVKRDVDTVVDNANSAEDQTDLLQVRDSDDLVFNVGYTGSDNLELALIHFDVAEAI